MKLKLEILDELKTTLHQIDNHIQLEPQMYPNEEFMEVISQTEAE